MFILFMLVMLVSLGFSAIALAEVGILEKRIKELESKK